MSNQSASANPTIGPVWRIEGRPNPFVRWIVLEQCWRLEAGVARLPQVKRAGKFYAVRIRAN